MWNSITITRAERICHTDEMRSFLVVGSEQLARIGIRDPGKMVRKDDL